MRNLTYNRNMSKSDQKKLENTTLEERFGKCPYATAQSLISGKWAVLILHDLDEGPLRFNALQRAMPRMTHATLSEQLKSLVESGLAARTADDSVPQKVEYSLTAIGKKFHPVIEAIEHWGEDYIDYLKEEHGKEP